jgi:triacylglycerol lipase
MASSSSSSGPLSGKYVVLAHGILGFDDTQGMAAGLVKYWGSLDNYLRGQGAQVLTPGKTAMQGLDARAIQQRDQINSWMSSMGKTNTSIIILGHSQGGLDSRWMVRFRPLANGNKVYSLTSIDTPHWGTPIADIGLAVIPNWMKPFVAACVNAIMGLIYSDSQQDLIAMTESMRISYMPTFNSSVCPNVSGVKYYSYGSYMTMVDLIQHTLLSPLHPIVWAGGLFYGVGSSNDGAVPYSSQKWGTWKGRPSWNWYATGLDHLQMTNFEWTGQNYFDVEGFYLQMAQNGLN